MDEYISYLQYTKYEQHINKHDLYSYVASSSCISIEIPTVRIPGLPNNENNCLSSKHEMVQDHECASNPSTRKNTNPRTILTTIPEEAPGAQNSSWIGLKRKTFRILYKL